MAPCGSNFCSSYLYFVLDALGSRMGNSSRNLTSGCDGSQDVEYVSRCLPGLACLPQ